MGGRIGEGTPRMANERLLEQSIPDRSPGHTFVAIARAGWRRHTKESRAGVVAWYSELARRILPRPTPSPAGDKPPRYISRSPRLDSGPVSGYGTCSRRNDELGRWNLFSQECRSQDWLP